MEKEINDCIDDLLTLFKRNWVDLYKELIGIYEDMIEQYELIEGDDDRLEWAIWRMDLILDTLYFRLNDQQRKKIRELFHRFENSLEEKHPEYFAWIEKELIGIYEDMIEQYELIEGDDDRLEWAIWRMDLIVDTLYFRLNDQQRKKIRELFHRFENSLEEKHPEYFAWIEED